MIYIENLHKSYRVGNREVSALHDLSLHIPKGKIFGIIGRSGAGKSTLLRTFNLLERPTRGSVRIDGVDITTLAKADLDRTRQHIGMVFQNFNLLSAKTVGANVEFPLKLAGGFTREERQRRVDELLELVGLSAHKDKYPAQLSGGQKQRVGIARAIANAPRLLLCDEATSALDPETTQSILALLAEINARLGLTIVLITHEMQVIRSICDRVAVIEAGDIVETGEVSDVFLHPKHPVTRALVAEYTHDDVDLTGVRAGADSGRRVRLTYVGDTAYQPILTHVVEQTRATITILQGAVSRIKDKPYGQLLVEIGGGNEEAGAVIDLFRRLDVHCEVLN
ncbi:methionine ABC transporter ATP-binding protein [Noviherbaspirillum sp. UKPF54]|uniref:methionine ABC transporter ATP-binding protein n=1 Tax=Noviherbaspirillum sp. UKPF54 TaxID=2601898 RepID=UPI0011B1A54E|nr:methionine ABC transporter ATP-binding protein [Noviherbaspirillum sp. UKPF54]QDZ30575.1 methionine ABC transporter ATP-binding protein [Noviherbaspirillum sp. UKPF54]